MLYSGKRNGPSPFFGKDNAPPMNTVYMISIRAASGVWIWFVLYVWLCVRFLRTAKQPPPTVASQGKEYETAIIFTRVASVLNPREKGEWGGFAAFPMSLCEVCSKPASKKVADATIACHPENLASVLPPFRRRKQCKIVYYSAIYMLFDLKINKERKHRSYFSNLALNCHHSREKHCLNILIIHFAIVAGKVHCPVVGARLCVVQHFCCPPEWSTTLLDAS